MEEGAIRGVDIAQALRRLSPEDRLALHLFFYVDLPLTEAAAAMGVSVPAARSRIYRALKRLRPELELHEEAL
jgi:RNA polymerase sigma factor (sigma-70 family)